MILADGLAQPSLAGIITAISAVILALGVLVGALPALILVLRRSKKADEKLDDVHHIVNQQRTDAMRYQRALIKALQAQGIDVPEDQSIDEAPVAE